MKTFRYEREWFVRVFILVVVVSLGMHVCTYADDEPIVLEGDTTVEGKLDVTGEVTAASFTGAVPSGFIGMWTGSTVPTGWKLCDGTNGTPDLRGKFIMGANANQTDLGNNGGANSITLTTSQMPEHSHGATIYSSSHMHSITDPKHSHTYYNSGNNDHDNDTDEWGQGPGYWSNTSSKATGISINNSSHAHSISIGNTGAGTAFNNRPAYYVLAYIMKI